jgi:hypothetical protein
MRRSRKKTLGLVCSALVLAGLAWGCEATPTVTVEFPTTLARPTAALTIEATYDAAVSASATALVATPPLPHAATPEQLPATSPHPTATQAHPPATLAETIQAPTVPAKSTNTSIPAANWGQRTKTSGCVASGSLPDPACTPGDVFLAGTKDQICTPGYSTSVRNVSESEREAVYAEYGIFSRTAGEYEVDHFVPLELGGSNDISNLFPEAASPKPGFHEKDEVANYLHEQMCSGAVTLSEAQREIATNWLAVYAQMLGGAAVPTAAATNPIMPQPTPVPIQPSAPTMAATQPAAASGFTVLALTSPVGVGSNAALQIQTASGASCFLTYFTPKGNKSTAQGLGATTANGSGVCAWTWRIGSGTTPGTGTLTVTANGVTRSIPIVIQ